MGRNSCNNDKLAILSSVDHADKSNDAASSVKSPDSDNSGTGKSDVGEGCCALRCSDVLFLVCLSAVTITSSLALCVFPPFFPRIAESKGFGATVYGCVIGTNCLVAFIVTPFIGRHIKNLGPKFTLISGIFASAVASVLCGLMEVHPAGALFICSAVAIRTVQSIGNAGIIISSFLYTSLQFPRNTGTIFALNRTALSVAQMVGPALGGMLHEAGGYCLPFAVFGCLHCLTAVPMILLAPASHDLAEVSSSEDCKKDASNCRVLRIPGMWVSFATFIVSTLSTGFLSITLESQILRKYHLTYTRLGLMFGLKDAACMVASPLWGWLSDKHICCVKPSIVACTVAAAVCFSLFGPLPGLHINQTLAMVIASLSVYGVAIGGMQICGVMDALREAIERGGFRDDPTTHGVVAGLWNSLSSGGRFVSRCGAGILVDTSGFASSSAVVVVLHVLLGLLTALHACLRQKCLNTSAILEDHKKKPDVEADVTDSGHSSPDPPESPVTSNSDDSRQYDRYNDPSNILQHSVSRSVPGARTRSCSETALSYLLGHSQKLITPSSYTGLADIL